MDCRIEIMKVTNEVINGRQTKTKAHFYSCWATPIELYGEEFYTASNIGYKNVLKFKVRYCNTIKALRLNPKSYIVKYDGLEYEVFNIDFKNNAKDYVFIKANAVI